MCKNSNKSSFFNVNCLKYVPKNCCAPLRHLHFLGLSVKKKIEKKKKITVTVKKIKKKNKKITDNFFKLRYFSKIIRKKKITVTAKKNSYFFFHG